MMYTERHPYKVNEHDFTLYIVLAVNVRLLCRKSMKHFRQPEFKQSLSFPFVHISV